MSVADRQRRRATIAGCRCASHCAKCAAGLRGFYVFIACIALGCMAIAGVGSLAASLADGLARQGQVILGGDLSFTLIQREVTPDERAFLDSHGKVSSAATLRAMARTADGKATLVEMKAVDGAYPLFGQAVLDPPGALRDALAQRDGVFGAVADPALLTRLDIKPGARLTVGNATFEIRAALASEPDKLAGGIGFGPRLLVSEDGPARHRPAAARQPGALALSPAAAGQRHQRRRGQSGDGAGARAISAKPAGISAAAATPRRSSSATSSASRNSSPSSA